MDAAIPTPRLQRNNTITIPKPSLVLRTPNQPKSKSKHIADDDSNNQPLVPSQTRQSHSIVPKPQDQIPEFPPPHVILHKDDAGSKVFHALARSLLSVDNRATTVKDLADLAVNNGLGCQNSSAATQAITTYLRMHNERCEADHDQPLLLSHNMSGTDADDDLIPALYSLQGGNPKKLCPNRKTNFRKNTTVWYLSRATGAACPFARAGIRLCDYDVLTEEDPEKEHKRRRSKHFDSISAGQKRKRPLRSCVASGLASDSESEKGEDKRPQKRLTLRIKLNGAFTPRPQPERSQVSSDDDSSDEEEPMEVDNSDRESEAPESKKEEEEEWRLPPYPRRSISIPCYTPSYEGAYPQFPLHNHYHDPFRRSPSLAFSSGSPPPDSEDEVDDFHITMTRTDDFPEDFSSESESEGETQFESPGPRSPSAPPLPSTSITVKEEPRDLQSMLDAWDDLDAGLTEPNVVRVEAGPLALKSEPLDLWDWDSEPTARIKQEDLSFDSLFPSDSAFSTPSLSSPSTSSRLTPEFTGSQSISHDDVQDSPSRSNTVRLRSKTVPVFSTPSSNDTPASLSVPPPPSLNARSNTISGESAESPLLPSSSSLPPSIASLIQSMNTLSAAVSPSSLVLSPVTPPSGSDAVVVHTCQPCSPPITATQIEDISVYQMVLGSFHFLRRIDTDFVNLSPIAAYNKSPFPVITTIPNATPIKGSPTVSGIWVPLSAAQAYLRDHPAEGSEFDIFLSDQLYERFPSALQDFVKSNVPTRSLNQFGRHFGSTLQQFTQHPPVPLTPNEVLARNPPQLQLQQITTPSPTSNAYTLSASLSISEKHHAAMIEPPLNAAEQEIFELCVVPDWDRDVDSGSSAPGSATPGPNAEPRGSRGESDMQVDEQECTTLEAGDSDSSSLTSLSSSPEVSGEDDLMKEGAGPSSPTLPAPPQSLKPSPSSSDEMETALPPASSDLDVGSIVKEGTKETSTGVSANEDSSTTVVPQRKRKGSSSRPNRPAPLRRSKRVAEIAAHHNPSSPSTSTPASVNTRSRRRGSRNSLS
ncbi:hypothetical protein CC1G_13964 [Coprinopsis cinerea okayama7|uniref:HTH APSES-type domain-containing protein n=1 Tax=Coprinopsis cinerea (strain Okayama-7 / 130 / ATCC MYA-4618 / FGSC 9003) TaxID=240176 RepID=D6RKH9_COPC7|nr:hypothetical protein CC1G_13964 [Coprinopsis cinerea okayama7\|eukprot:XP_002911924.1 hypothetical protein CC1G_13964 [Coprinopsis cinerea okayama7\